MNQRSLRPRAFAPAFAALVALYAAGSGIGLIHPAAAQETPSDTLAAHVRIQGHRCSKVVSAERDIAQSRPDSAVWTITCTEGAYRVQLVPHQAAKVEQIETKQ